MSRGVGIYYCWICYIDESLSSGVKQRCIIWVGIWWLLFYQFLWIHPYTSTMSFAILWCKIIQAVSWVKERNKKSCNAHTLSITIPRRAQDFTSLLTILGRMGEWRRATDTCSRDDVATQWWNGQWFSWYCCLLDFAKTYCVRVVTVQGGPY